MANVDVRKILVGAGDLYVSRDQTFGAAPTAPDFEGTEMGLQERMDDLSTDADGNPPEGGFTPEGWRYVGATQDGVELSYTPDYGEVEVDQLKGAALLFNTAVTVTASTTLAEADLVNLMVAWGVADEALEGIDGATGERFNIGAPGDDPIERQLAIIGKGNPVEVPNPDYTDEATTPDVSPTVRYARERAYYARRVISAEGATLALRRTEPTTYGVTFRLLPEGDNPGSEFGVIVDRVDPGNRPA